MGDRATEIAVVMVQDGKVVDRFQSLMNAGVRVSGFIEQFTGITNAMLAAAPPADKVMAEAARFVGSAPMVAHNAAFDRKFWIAELQRLDAQARNAFACTMLVSRRLYPQAPNHRLGSLVDYHSLPRFGQAHRAMADAEMAAALLGQIQQDMRARYGLDDAGHELLMKVQTCARNAVAAMVKSHAVPARNAAPAMIPVGLTQGFASAATPVAPAQLAAQSAPTTHVLRLSPGDDLRSALVTAFAELSRVHGVKAGCVISCVGSLSRAVLRYAAEDRGTETFGPLELITLSGTLSTGGVHLHASIADAQGRMTGGHLMPGCVVRTTAEVVLALLPEWEFEREMDAATGFKELVVRRAWPSRATGRALGSDQNSGQ